MTRREKALGWRWPLSAGSQLWEETVMRRLIRTVLVLLAAGAVGATTAWAGSPHFVNAVTATRTGNSLTVAGKEAGLGNEEAVHIVVSATAECINKGEKNPKAANKHSVSEQGTFPVQNGKANFKLTVTATFKPECAPPMTVAFTNVTVTDTTNNISVSLSGTF
jgi:hypothetical protein